MIYTYHSFNKHHGQCHQARAWWPWPGSPGARCYDGLACWVGQQLGPQQQQQRVSVGIHIHNNDFKFQTNTFGGS